MGSIGLSGSKCDSTWTAYPPRALLSVWLYGFMTGARSSRKLVAACRDQIPYLWPTGWQHPDHNAPLRFYKAHRGEMRTLMKCTVGTAVEMRLDRLESTHLISPLVWSGLTCLEVGRYIENPRLHSSPGGRVLARLFQQPGYPSFTGDIRLSSFVPFFNASIC
jgi:hypothetical protein